MSSTEPNDRPLWAKRLTERRKTLGISQAQFAEQIGASQSAVTDWERGKTRPRLGTLNRIAAALGVEMQYFFPEMEFKERETGRWTKREDPTLDPYFEIEKSSRQFAALFVAWQRMLEDTRMPYTMYDLALQVFKVWTSLEGRVDEDAIRRTIEKYRYRFGGTPADAEGVDDEYLASRYRLPD